MAGNGVRVYGVVIVTAKRLIRGYRVILKGTMAAWKRSGK